MPSFAVNVPNPLGKEQAAERLKGFLTKVRDRYQDQVKNLEESWEGDSLNFSFSSYGFTIKGLLVVEEEVIRINGDLPFAAMMFKGKIEQSITSELEKVLAVR